MSEFDAGYELTRFLVESLREDEALHALLFGGQAPINTFDERIFDSDADLAPYGLASVLPRVLVSVELDVLTWEQSTHTLGPAMIRVHHFAARDKSDLVAKMAKATDDLLASLGESPAAPAARIMIAPLAPVGPQIKDRQPAFDEARRITNSYATRLVGVLA